MTKSTMPLGAQVLSKIHGDVRSIVDVAAKASGPVDNVPVKKAITSQLKALRELLAEIEGLYGKSYPDLPALAAGETSVSQSVAKTWLAKHDRPFQRFSSFGRQLGTMAKAKNLTPAQRQILASAKSLFADTIGQSSEGLDALAIQHQKQINAKLAQISNKLARMMGTRR